jgi:hypothetical protein
MMDMKAIRIASLAALVALALTAPLLAQQDGDTVFAPYPSHIRVGVRGADVVITWEDSPDVTAGYAVYRQADFPDASRFQDALLLGYADSGSSEFVYTPTDDKPWYYFVLGRVPEADRADGTAEYRLFIPLRNIPLETVSVAPATPEKPLTPVPAAQQPPRLSGIIARTEGDSIVVSIDVSGDVGRLILYRSTKPFMGASSLLDAALTAIIDKDAGPYRDYPVPGVDYYYAIIPEHDLISGSITLASGVNTTVVPVSIKAGVYRIGLPASGATSRSMPLPYLVLTRGFEDAKPIGIDDPTPTTRPLSVETEKAISMLDASYGSTTKAPRPPITIYPEDLQSGGGGEEYALRSIVSSYLAKGDYAEATREFTLYLSLPRSPANANRALFYRGQAQAIIGAWREAFFDLLQVQDSYYIECAAWFDYILEELRD